MVFLLPEDFGTGLASTTAAWGAIIRPWRSADKEKRKRAVVERGAGGGTRRGGRDARRGDTGGTARAGGERWWIGRVETPTKKAEW